MMKVKLIGKYGNVEEDIAMAGKLCYSTVGIDELEEYLVPECEYLLWCPEGKSSCGKAPTKKEFKEILKRAKEGRDNEC